MFFFRSLPRSLCQKHWMLCFPFSRFWSFFLTVVLFEILHFSFSSGVCTGVFVRTALWRLGWLLFNGFLRRTLGKRATSSELKLFSADSSKVSGKLKLTEAFYPDSFVTVTFKFNDQSRSSSKLSVSTEMPASGWFVGKLLSMTGLERSITADARKSFWSKLSLLNWKTPKLEIL